MLRLFPREKQELPMQIVMLAAEISGMAQLLSGFKPVEII